MSGSGADPKKNRIAKLKIIVDSPLKVSDFTYDIEYRTYRYVKRSGEVVPSKLMKIHDAKFPTQNGNIAFSYPYNLLTYYDYIKILDDQPISRSGRVKFVVYQNNNGHKIKIKELPIDWYYQSENNPVTLKIHVTGSPNGEPDNTHKTGNLGNNLKASFTAFVGGAADKYQFLKRPLGFDPPDGMGAGPTEIMKDCLKNFQKNIPNSVKNASFEYYGYEEAYGKYSIGKKYNNKALLNLINDIIKVLNVEPKTQINLVGHSLGGWNVAGLAEELSKNKICKVNCLITIDPVGTRISKTLVVPTPIGTIDKAAVYILEPDPVSNLWVNIYSNPKDNERDDYIAESGGRWHDDDTAKANYNHTSTAHHGEAEKMFTEKGFSNNKLSASDILLSEISKIK